MYWIRMLDFARLYRVEQGNPSKRDLELYEDFKRRNPECPQTLRAENFIKAKRLNAQIFAYL